LNEETGVHLFRTTLWLAATSGISRVLEYSIRYSTEYSSSKKLDSHSPNWHHSDVCHTSQPAGECCVVSARGACSFVDRNSVNNSWTCFSRRRSLSSSSSSSSLCQDSLQPRLKVVYMSTLCHPRNLQ